MRTLHFQHRHNPRPAPLRPFQHRPMETMRGAEERPSSALLMRHFPETAQVDRHELRPSYVHSGRSRRPQRATDSFHESQKLRLSLCPERPRRDTPFFGKARSFRQLHKPTDGPNPGGRCALERAQTGAQLLGGQPKPHILQQRVPRHGHPATSGPPGERDPEHRGRHFQGVHESGGTVLGLEQFDRCSGAES